MGLLCLDMTGKWAGQVGAFGSLTVVLFAAFLVRGRLLFNNTIALFFFICCGIHFGSK